MIICNDDGHVATVTVSSIRSGNEIRLGIHAPGYRVFREELLFGKKGISKDGDKSAG